MSNEPSKQFKDGMAVLRTCGYVSRFVYLEAMEHMEEKYPGRGWKEAAKNLEDWYAERNLALVGRAPGIEFKTLTSKNGFKHG